MDDSVLRNDAELRGIGLDNLELDRPHATTDKESIALSHRSVCCGGHISKSNLHRNISTYLPKSRV